MSLSKVLAVVGLLVASPTHSDAPPQGDVVVLVDCPRSLGTAVKVSDNEYVTAYHVVDTPGCTIDGQEVVVERVYADKDIATIRGPSYRGQVEISCKGYKPGKEYMAKGFGLGTYMEVPWMASSHTQRGFHVFYGEAIPGMSGGPLLDKKGRIRGIVNMRWPARSASLEDTHLCKGE